MENDAVYLDSDMKDAQEEFGEQSVSLFSSAMGDIFGDQQVLPRVGDEYQAEIPPLIAKCERLQLISITRNSKSMVHIDKSFNLGLPIPLMWSNTGDENITRTSESENSEDSQITSNNEYPELKVEPMESLSGYGENKGVHSSIQQAAGTNKMQADSILPQEFEMKINRVERSSCPLPGSMGESWTDVEHDSFLLGLYIFGRNLIAVKKFVESKDMGDILSFYYGKFYRSDGYRRWSECRKLRSRWSIHGQKIFTGWRQQELLSRFFSHVSQECQSMLLEVSRKFAEGKISFEEYVFTLKSAVGINMFIEAVGIGKGKHDLTGIAMEPTKPGHINSIRPEIPIGKACSSLTSSDIIKFLTGDFRLSKARSNHLFWEAVWPRLLARGWHSEQPKDNGSSGSKHSLVFLIPGVKKFSRRRLVKSKHYFDSVSDVLNKVASDPGLLELEIEEVKGSKHKEECNWDPSLKLDQDGLINKQHQCYLQPHRSNYSQDVPKFTVVDTSLAHGAEQHKVRELRSLPVETTGMSTSSSLSSETQEDTSENSQENAEESNTSYPAEDVTVSSSDCANNLPNIDRHNYLCQTIAAEENNENKIRSVINAKEEKKTMKYQFGRKVKSSCSKYLVPITNQQSDIACDPKDSSCSNKNMSAERQLNEDESHCTAKSHDTCEHMVVQESPMQNSSPASSLAKDSPVESNEGIVGENCLGREAYPENTQSPKLIDLNIPHVSPDFPVTEPIMTDREQDDDNSCENKSVFLSGTGQQPEPFKLPDAGPHLAQQPLANSRRQSTRNRPLTTKALEALELGFFSPKKKRKGADISESNSLSGSSRQVRKRIRVKATPKDVAANYIADSRSIEFLDGFHGGSCVMNDSML
ncbi:hypothetical protein JCGZ_13880 [Jatropha curcas]|uniref:SANT domain-containing protein n=1 Tax=Jatropha curcas TaxID=180498 RepID=A0A067K8H2_JATCU|nr:uncharacterized protein LOC105642479 isoform X2 [Jatropha curcas]KDP28109.1 hypothetical protein JCGZ_13880 [Jatropha curcas]